LPSSETRSWGQRGGGDEEADGRPPCLQILFLRPPSAFPRNTLTLYLSRPSSSPALPPLCAPCPLYSPLSAVQSERTALHLAASDGHLEVCRLLLDRKANVNVKDNVSIMRGLRAGLCGWVCTDGGANAIGSGGGRVGADYHAKTKANLALRMTGEGRGGEEWGAWQGAKERRVAIRKGWRSGGGDGERGEVWESG